MNLANVFRSDAFSFLTLTTAINILPVEAVSADEIAKFAESGINTVTAMVEEKEGRIGIVKSAPRGSVGTGLSSKNRKVRTFAVPHFPTYDAILASEVQGVRQFGSTDVMETLASKLAEKQADMQAYLTRTQNFAKWGAIQGICYDEDGSVLFDWHDTFGVIRNEFTIDLDDANLNLVAELVKLKRQAEKELGGYSYSKFVLPLPAAVFDRFVTHVSVREAYNRWQDGAFLRADNRKGFILADNVEIRSMDVIDIGNGLTIIPEDCGFLVPDAAGLFKVNFAPADTVEAANTIGLPYYMASEPMKFGKGVDLAAESNHVAYNEKPRTVVRVHFI
ncbi:major capsid protein [Rhizobium leguminosarum]|uniref:major capsid protein n=1 Tax=Rhizobium leguminosarum TaxID=384 RepID=UPI003F96D070